jgi:hypothetical protein
MFLPGSTYTANAVTCWSFQLLKKEASRQPREETVSIEGYII